MRQESADTVIRYYAEIPGMLKALRQEKAEIDLEYNSIRGMGQDAGTGGSGRPGNPTERLAIRMAENCFAGKRLKEIEIREQVLERDGDLIRGCLDGLNSKYKRLIILRGVHKYSWGRISAGMRIPESTARDWYERAKKKFREILEDVPMSRELIFRASRAR